MLSVGVVRQILHHVQAKLKTAITMKMFFSRVLNQVRGFDLFQDFCPDLLMRFTKIVS